MKSLYLGVVHAYTAGFRTADPEAVLACFASSYFRFDYNGAKHHTQSEKHKQGLKAYMEISSQHIDITTFQVASFEVLDESPLGAVGKATFVAQKRGAEEEIKWNSWITFQAHQKEDYQAKIVTITTLNRHKI